MYNFVRKYVRSCTTCQPRMSPSSSSVCPLQSLPSPEKPFDSVGIDLHRHFPSTENRWVMVAADHLTGYAVTPALPAATARDVASFIIRRFILGHGALRQLLSDWGSVFSSDAECYFVRRTSSSYHPQTNGVTKRFNRTLGGMLSM